MYLGIVDNLNLNSGLPLYKMLSQLSPLDLLTSSDLERTFCIPILESKSRGEGGGLS